jgi:hypothetical protein
MIWAIEAGTVSVMSAGSHSVHILVGDEHDRVNEIPAMYYTMDDTELIKGDLREWGLLILFERFVWSHNQSEGGSFVHVDGPQGRVDFRNGEDGNVFNLYDSVKLKVFGP